MRIDFESRALACSVGDLVHDAAARRIGLDRGEGFRRMWLGQEIHSRRAEERMGADPNYRSEMPIALRFERNGWNVAISGRIDGISIDPDRKLIVIEEVKSVHFDLELVALKKSDKLQRHLYQLMIYAYALSLDDAYAGHEIHPQLVLIDLVTGRDETIDSPFDRDEVERALHASLDAMLDRLESERALQLAKRAFAEDLEFPFGQLRPYQREMMDAVARAVVEKEALLASAPTGIGKTIAALFPALRESLRRGRKLFFLTSKTLQQEIAVETLRRVNDGSFRVLRIRAKQKMCAHTQMICHEDYCPYASRYAEKMQKSGLIERLVASCSYFDPELIFEEARGEQVCPFEVSLELLDQADVVICDYNYIFDPWIGFRSMQDDGNWGDAVLVIDEAHNLVERGRGYYSPELDQKQLEAVAAHLASRTGFIHDGWHDLLRELDDHFNDLATEAFEEIGEGGPDDTPQALCEPSRSLFLRQRRAWEELIIRYISWKIQNRIAEEEDPLVDFYFRLVRFQRMLAEDGEEFARIIERTRDGLRLKVFCKDASKFLGEVIESTAATIAMSATLEPFDFYRQMLGFPRDRVAEIAFPSPFPAENRRIVVISDVDTTWKERSRHYGRIAELVGEMAGAADGNFLALFPSYRFLEEVTTRLPAVSKRLLVQRSDMTDWERRNFLDLLREPGQGHLVLAVSGGMYAEGIDYQGEMLSGVFVVGPALPTVNLERELLKRYYDEQYGAGFEYAYLIPGMTRVIQSAGRVIRSESDHGVIALLCKRFSRPQYARYFPAHWYDESPRELISRKPVEAVREFFEWKRAPQLRMF